MRHVLAVIVRSCNLKLVYLKIQNLTVIIKQYISNYFIQAVNANLLIVFAGAKTAAGTEAKSMG
jgi:hypothetical protein